MSKKENLFEKIKNGSKKVRIAKLCKLMEYYGFEVYPSKEGYYFTHDQLKDIELVRVPIPHKESGESYVKQPYVDKCIKAIKMLVDLES
jgi:hypothetical protein